MLSEFEVIDDDDFEKWFAKSKPLVASECAKLREDVWFWKRRKFDGASAEYSKAQKPDIRDFWGIGSGPVQTDAYTNGRILVSRLIKTMFDGRE